MGILNALFNEGDIRNLFGEEVENTPGAPATFKEAWLYKNLIEPLMALEPPIKIVPNTPEERDAGILSNIKNFLSIGLQNKAPEAKSDLIEPPGTTAPGGQERAAEAKKKAKDILTGKQGSPSPQYSGPASDVVKQAAVTEALATTGAGVPSKSTLPQEPPSAKFPTPPELKDINTGEELSKILGQVKSYDELAGPTPSFFQTTMQGNPLWQFAWAFNQAKVGKDPYEMIRREDETLRGIHAKKVEWAKAQEEKAFQTRMKDLEFRVSKQKEDHEARKQFIDASLKANPRLAEDPNFMDTVMQTYKLPREYIQQIIAKNTDAKTGKLTGFYIKPEDELTMKYLAKVQFIKAVKPELSDEDAKNMAFLAPEKIGELYMDAKKMNEFTLNTLLEKRRSGVWGPEDDAKLAQVMEFEKFLLTKKKEIGLEEFNQKIDGLNKIFQSQMAQMKNMPSYYQNGKWTPAGQASINTLEKEFKYAMESALDVYKLGERYGGDMAVKKLELRHREEHPYLYVSKGAAGEGKFIPPTDMRQAAMIILNPGINGTSKEAMVMRDEKRKAWDSMDILFQQTKGASERNVAAGKKPIDLVTASKGQTPYGGDYALEVEGFKQRIRNMPNGGQILSEAQKKWGSFTAIPIDVYVNSLANPMYLISSFNDYFPVQGQGKKEK